MLPGGPYSLSSLLAIVPVIIIAGINLFVPFFSSRPMLLFTPFLLLVLSRGVISIGRSGFRFSVPVPMGVALLLIIMHYSSVELHKQRPSSPLDYKGFSEKWIPNIKASDLIFVERHWITTRMFYYLKADRYHFVGQGHSAEVTKNGYPRVWLLSFGRFLQPNENMKSALVGYERLMSIEGRIIKADLYGRHDEGDRGVNYSEKLTEESAVPTTSVAFSTYLNGGSWVTLREIAFDSAGNIVVVGHGDFSPDAFPGSKTIGRMDDSNIIVAKLHRDGSQLLWGTLIGGSGRDRGYGVAVDQKNEIYVAGRTSSPNFPTTMGAYDQTFNGGTPNPAHGASDAFVLKLSADGQSLQYSTFLGGSKNDRARGGLAVDAEGSAYVVGATESSDYLAGDLARVNTYLGGHSDAFITKVSPDGSSIVYSRFLGGSNNTGRKAIEMAPGVQVDDQGHAYIHVIVHSTDASTTPNAFQSFNGGKSDSYFAKLSEDGKQLLYATYFGGSGNEFAEHGMALDKRGNVYVVGQTRSPDFPVINAHQPRLGGGLDGYLVKLDPLGQPVFSTYIDAEVATGPAVDAHGNIFVTGSTGSSDFETTPNAYDRSFNGVNDAFLRIYGRTGKLLYSTFIGGSKHEFGRYVAVDAFGDPIIIGETSSSDFPTTPGAYSRTHAGEEDGFLTKFKLAHPFR